MVAAVASIKTEFLLILGVTAALAVMTAYVRSLALTLSVCQARG